MPPRRPRVVTPDEPKYDTWDAYMEEATAGLRPFTMPMPDGSRVEVACPTGDQMEALGRAQQRGDDALAFHALFGEEIGNALLAATKDAPFLIRAKIVQDVMMHYGQQVSNLGDSSASSR